MVEQKSAHPLLDAVAKVAGKVQNILEHGQPTFREMIFLTRYASFDPTWANYWIAALRRMQSGGAATYDAAIVRRWREGMKSQWAEKVSQEGNYPWKFAPLLAEYYPAGSSTSFFAHNPNQFVRQMVRAGRFVVIEGDLEKGKTATATWLFYQLHKLYDQYQADPDNSDLKRFWDELSEGVDSKKDALGLIYAKGVKFVANITIYPPEPGKPSPYFEDYQFAPSLERVIALLSRNAMEGYLSVLCIDEAGFNVNKKRVQSKPVFAIESIARLIRKFNTVVIWATQSGKGDLPGFLRDDTRPAKTMIKKISQKVGEVFVEGSENLEHVLIRDFPNSPMRFETKGLAAMDVNFDPQDLANEMEAKRYEAMEKGTPFTNEDMYRFAEMYCLEVIARNDRERRERMMGTVGGNEDTVPDPAIVADIRLLRDQVNPETGYQWTVTEMASSRGIAVADVTKIINLLKSSAPRRVPKRPVARAAAPPDPAPSPPKDEPGSTADIPSAPVPVPSVPPPPDSADA